MERGWRSGPRPNLSPTPELDYYDPAKRICFNCGERVGIMDFVLVHKGAVAGHWRLCGPCWSWGNPPDRQAADPLDVTI